MRTNKYYTSIVKTGFRAFSEATNKTERNMAREIVRTTIEAMSKNKELEEVERFALESMLVLGKFKKSVILEIAEKLDRTRATTTRKESSNPFSSSDEEDIAKILSDALNGVNPRTIDKQERIRRYGKMFREETSHATKTPKSDTKDIKDLVLMLEAVFGKGNVKVRKVARDNQAPSFKVNKESNPNGLTFEELLRLIGGNRG